ncbi:uncharacterized protein LOC125422875 isoform X2 [Ziziphus jujuba]|uniref:Uncharacterized protein LOC125422875 isoform X2 n=1 Tax=Ziziphus jujuba TaxID=326968 RepID=A0ABM3ILS8_ZIZJJ|nr:uncharacterized protein LOC125422875 isoform X2 [Ziziphus jujuba]
MEVVYLLCSIISTFFTSLTFSFLLLLRTLLHRFFSPHRPSSSSSSSSSSFSKVSESVSLFEGTVRHERRRPLHHSFRYAVRYALIDLDHADHPPPNNHLSAHEARRIAATTGPVLLLTMPSNVGYEQNPLSVYYCYDVQGTEQNLRKCIAEVTNTPWGERVTFVFNPQQDLVAKPLHVSPFMDMSGNWSIRANAPGDNLFVAITVQHPELGDYFTATLNAKKLSPSSMSDHAIFFWLMPHKVAVWIYWHALMLWWKGVPFIQHPRYTHPAYREEVLVRDRKLQCCQAVGNSGARCFAWKNAKWPWC